MWEELLSGCLRGWEEDTSAQKTSLSSMPKSKSWIVLNYSNYENGFCLFFGVYHKQKPLLYRFSNWNHAFKFWTNYFLSQLVSLLHPCSFLLCWIVTKSWNLFDSTIKESYSQSDNQKSLYMHVVVKKICFWSTWFNNKLAKTCTQLHAFGPYFGTIPVRF